MIIPNPLEEGWQTLAEVRAQLGHTGLETWLRKTRAIKSEMQIYNGRTYVSISLIERYLEATSHPVLPRLTRRPKGWWGITRVREVLSCGAVAPGVWATQGKLTAVQVGNSHFYDPESVERLRLERQKPLPGYVQLREVIIAARGKVIRQNSAKNWLLDNGYPVKFFYVDSFGYRRSMYTTLEGAAAWLEMWKAKRPTPTPRRLNLSAEQVEAFQEAFTSGMRVADIATAHNISREHMSKLVRGVRIPKTARPKDSHDFK